MFPTVQTEMRELEQCQLRRQRQAPGIVKSETSCGLQSAADRLQICLDLTNSGVVGPATLQVRVLQHQSSEFRYDIGPQNCDEGGRPLCFLEYCNSNRRLGSWQRT